VSRPGRGGWVVTRLQAAAAGAGSRFVALLALDPDRLPGHDHRWRTTDGDASAGMGKRRTGCSPGPQRAGLRGGQACPILFPRFSPREKTPGACPLLDRGTWRRWATTSVPHAQAPRSGAPGPASCGTGRDAPCGAHVSTASRSTEFQSRARRAAYVGPSSVTLGRAGTECLSWPSAEPSAAEGPVRRGHRGGPRRVRVIKSRESTGQMPRARRGGPGTLHGGPGLGGTGRLQGPWERWARGSTTRRPPNPSWMPSPRLDRPDRVCGLDRGRSRCAARDGAGGPTAGGLPGGPLHLRWASVMTCRNCCRGLDVFAMASRYEGPALCGLGGKR